MLFKDSFYFLSNFYQCNVMFDGIVYSNAESAFQAQKCVVYEDRKKFCNLTGAEARSLGRKVVLRSDWELSKVSIMKSIIRAKFLQNQDLASNLISTGDMELVEENTWNDRFWGVCNGEGQNMLGRILMDTRKWVDDVPIIFIASKKQWAEYMLGFPIFISRTVDKKIVDIACQHTVWQWTDLAPSSSLFSDYLNWSRKGVWNKNKFDTEYVPRFLMELKKECISKKADHQLNKLVMDYRADKIPYSAITLMCHCNDETVCHRSIIAGLLKGLGDIKVCSYDTFTDYPNEAIKYHQMYKVVT